MSRDQETKRPEQSVDHCPFARSQQFLFLCNPRKVQVYQTGAILVTSCTENTLSGCDSFVISAVLHHEQKKVLYLVQVGALLYQVVVLDHLWGQDLNYKNITNQRSGPAL